MRNILAVLASAWLTFPVSAHADSIIPPPWACVQLNVAPGWMYDHPTSTVPLYAEPSASSPVVGSASDTMVAKWPQPETAGFVQVVLRRDRLAWIDARYVRPWANPYAPAARCQPILRSDGVVGVR